METVDKKVNVYVAITPVASDKVDVRIGFSILSYKQKGSDLLSCYIPAFDINYSAADIEAANHKGVILMRSFTDHFFMHTKNGLKGVVLELHKLGFKTSDDMITVKQLINNNAVKAKFQPIKAYSGKEFSKAKKVDQEFEIQMALA